MVETPGFRRTLDREPRSAALKPCPRFVDRRQSVMSRLPDAAKWLLSGRAKRVVQRNLDAAAGLELAQRGFNLTKHSFALLLWQLLKQRFKWRGDVNEPSPQIHW